MSAFKGEADVAYAIAYEMSLWARWRAQHWQWLSQVRPYRFEVRHGGLSWYHRVSMPRLLLSQTLGRKHSGHTRTARRERFSRAASV